MIVWIAVSPTVLHGYLEGDGVPTYRLVRSPCAWYAQHYCEGFGWDFIKREDTCPNPYRYPSQERAQRACEALQETEA